ncbi:hypothetical protein EVAR_42408_1 [Eumeta japonica]|uniref:Uncharacterized protein n=1 Tax=Eumeta variegata TaxID=151549 RepID=A0A4C1X8J6_EUMVA|nr:hypothetical protein EVAR_42408_1 [Eumeta japonica]
MYLHASCAWSRTENRVFDLVEGERCPTSGGRGTGTEVHSSGGRARLIGEEEPGAGLTSAGGYFVAFPAKARR